MNYALREVPAGRDLVVTGPWSASTQRAFHTSATDGLVLNYALGYQERNLQFLHGLPIRRLTILARTTEDLDPIYDLADTLVDLDLQVGDHARLDLKRLRNLTSLSADWVQIRETIRDAKNLEHLFVLSYSEESLEPLSQQNRLNSLRMKDRPKLRSLKGLEGMSLLKTLEIYSGSFLADFSSLFDGTAPTLKHLALESCKQLGSVEFTGLSELEVLNIADCRDIESLNPLRHALQLVRLWAYESTTITDGDLAPLLNAPRLQELRMKNRRHYSPTVQQVQDVLAARHN